MEKDPIAGEENIAAAESARNQAEKRRQRILERAQTRMGVVSGEQALDDEEQKASVSNAARIRAARARRYGKKTATVTPVVADSSTETTTSVDAPGQVGSEAASESKEAGNSNTEDEAPAPETCSSSEEPTKKKYMGVAKMRRKMLLKKKQEENEAINTALLNTKSSTKQGKGLTKSKGSSVPIIMHIVTTALLFLCGFDVGLQFHHEEVQTHTKLAIHEHGIPLLHRSLTDSKKEIHRSQQLLAKSMGVLQDHADAAGEGDDDKLEDEFDLPEEEYEPIIDPLFRIDLDEATKGPGIMNQLARSAVAAHRMILWACYYTPMSILSSITNLPKALTQTPPALAAIAMVLRQIVGKVVLGARLPAPEGDEKNPVEVLAMIKKAVTGFLTGMFPSAVKLYELFTDLRTDMYIILCGVFVGMVLEHFYMTVGLSESGRDEL